MPLPLLPLQCVLVLILLCFGSSFRISWSRPQLKALMASVERGMHLERLVERKKAEVDNLLRRHQAEDDPLVMRLSYSATDCKFNMTRALKRDPAGKDQLHTLSVTVDMKRRSPTILEHREVVDFDDCGHYAGLLAKIGVNALFANTDDMEYGGKWSDLKDASKTVRALKPLQPPAVICKDIIIHPIQIAQALEHGASGVLLITSIVGGDLEALLDACTLMGTEALVEVHSPRELHYALEQGATNFLVNLWDRTTGELYSQQARALADLFPMNTVAIVAGNLHTKAQVAEFGFYGYDGVVIGRRIRDMPEIDAFVRAVHTFQGARRDYSASLGMKSLPIQY